MSIAEIVINVVCATVLAVYIFFTIKKRRMKDINKDGE